MELLAILPQIFEVVIIPLLGILAGFVIQFIRVKNEEIKTKTDSELVKKYADMLTETITTCVQSTNQTYVETLKKEGNFDKEAQVEAFKRTSDAVLAQLTDEATTYLEELYGDLTGYIITKIEATVQQEKA